MNHQDLIEVAKKYTDYHMEKFEYTVSNVEFRVGYIERLNELAFEDGSFDIILYLFTL